MTKQFGRIQFNYNASSESQCMLPRKSRMTISSAINHLLILKLSVMSAKEVNMLEDCYDKASGNVKALNGIRLSGRRSHFEALVRCYR